MVDPGEREEGRNAKLSLRATLLAVALAAGVYTAALPLYLYFRVSRPALALGAATETITIAGENLARRDSALDQVLVIVRALARRASPGASSLTLVHRLLEIGRTPLALAAHAPIPDTLRAQLLSADGALSRNGSALAEAVSAIEQGEGRVTSVAARLPALEDLGQVVNDRMAGGGRIARAYLLQRQRALQAAAGEVRRDTALWIVVGILWIPLLVLVLRRRVSQPLHALEAGLGRVADGDLTVAVPTVAADEIGRLAEHFNTMTRVLRDRAEEQGRFAAAGELLAGVAHEVNNPLMAIAAHAENRLADAAVQGEQRNEMGQILRQARRATKLLRGLLRFVRATEREVTRVNLNDVVRGGLDLVSFRFGVDEIAVGGHLDPNLPAVEGDAIKLEQVVVNLLSNAIDALRGVKPPRQLTVDTWVEDARVSVSVTDNGKGVSPEISSRLFRPFATTKGRRGTGLGLYISRQIAREAGGDLVLAPSPGGGARFVLSLPVASGVVGAVPLPARAPAPVSADVAQPPSPQAVPSLTGVRVLIVEDEEPVRRPMLRYLARKGAQVEEASDGAEALTRLRERPVDVILADLRMPRMGGMELYAQLEEERPELAARVLFLSGDVSQLAEPGNAPVPRERVLVKPLELAELERRILEFVVAARKGRGGT
ncbi:MAG TPA: ATP-binding protein [Gemmatimonadales bacterium]|nr:ATP-binding protein [Gemmatimonadales bacterium]